MRELLAIILVLFIILALPYVLTSLMLTFQIITEFLDDIGVADFFRELFDKLMNKETEDETN